MFLHKNLDDLVDEIKSFGNLLMPYNFPQSPAKEEEDINILKAREVTIDGYSLVLHYSKARHQDHYLETLQILGKYVPFLPFSLVCKIGKRFLGDQYLSLVEIFRDNRKIYCWTLVSNYASKPIIGPYSNEEHRTYEGLEYRAMNPKEVNFY